MNLKKKLAVVAAGAGVAPLILVALPAGVANAHGYVSSPPSRQAQCAQGTVSCGSIKWEPQSVEGPKGLRSCSGGNSRFSELDDDGKGWRATPVGNSVTFKWTFTARHATANYEYFLNGRRIAEFNGNGQQPPPTISHNVNLGGVSGRQKVLAVWNIGDTGNAFYACIDLNVNGGGDPDPEPTTTTTTPPPDTTTTTPPPSSGTWEVGTAYQTGSEVTYNGSSYRCRQTHTAIAGWEPANTPALWQEV
ncbi:lytic polysaccharide monooxygenase [Amycolatopsis cihanbeyliensis]|uniref:Chitin-binding protein n=1 Tax=Amycolatopsis cihanbeyliensis TaxID=1128664 RepID=A0A542DCZ6_AMYCI|nr:lytic polysaccharide monooxygenase [Amycolatopsis cihanbeyliensis]TQJ00935.1 chitin-binding protein [Amycolatopsis cihanbeyliensis]